MRLMAMKDFDWKGFMIQKGERVALGVAGFLTLLLFVLSMKSFFIAGPVKQKELLEKKTKEVDSRRASNKPSKPEDTPEGTEAALRNFEFTKITDPSLYQLASMF